MMATNLSECHVSNKRTPRALTLPPAKAHPSPKPGRNGRKPKGPVVPPTHQPGPPKPRPKPVGPGPGGRNGPESKGSGLAMAPPPSTRAPAPSHDPSRLARAPGHSHPPPPTTQVLNYGVWLRVCLRVSFPGAARTRYYTLVPFVSLSEKYTTRYYSQYGFCTQKYTPRIFFRYCLDTFPILTSHGRSTNILPGYFLDMFLILFRYYTQYRFCTRVQQYTPRILFRYFLDTFSILHAASILHPLQL